MTPFATHLVAFRDGRTWRIDAPGHVLHGKHQDTATLEARARAHGLALDLPPKGPDKAAAVIRVTDITRAYLAEIGEENTANRMQARGIRRRAIGAAKLGRDKGISEAEVARLLDVPRSTVRRWSM